jgi:trigger factor
MKVEIKELAKSEVELKVELSVEEMLPFVDQAVKKISETIKIEGFRPGKVPYDILKQKIGEMSILEEAANIAIYKTIDKAVNENLKDKDVVGRPKIDVLKMAPGNPLEYRAIIALLPEVTLGTYKDLGIKQEEVKIDEKDFARTKTELTTSRAKETLSSEPVKDGDKVIVSIEMFQDKVPLENGQAQEVTIIMGKDYLVPGFDTKLLNAKKDQELEFELVYPSDHHQANLAGKLVAFKVKIKDIFNREIPAWDDNLSHQFGFKKIEDLEGFLRQNMEARLKQQSEEKSEIIMLDKLIENTKFGDIPETLIHNESETMMHELEHNISEQGGRFEDYLASIKKTKNELALEFLPQAVKRVKSALLLREVAKVHDIKITPEEIDEQVQKLRAQYKDNEEVIKTTSSPHYLNYLGNMLANQKVIKQLREWNIQS